MSELYLMATISDRNQSRRFLAFYKEYGISVTFLTLGRGTAASEVLDAFGLEASEKTARPKPSAALLRQARTLSACGTFWARRRAASARWKRRAKRPNSFWLWQPAAKSWK